jgi:hypothetical protein
MTAEILAMADLLDNQPDEIVNGGHIGWPKSNSFEAAAMLRKMADERNELLRLLYAIYPDPDHETKMQYYNYFEANPLPPVEA